MVRIKSVDLDKAIKLYKMRIKHHEKHGNGSVVIKDKNALQKMEHTKELRKEKGL